MDNIEIRIGKKRKIHRATIYDLYLEVLVCHKIINRLSRKIQRLNGKVNNNDKKNR